MGAKTHSGHCYTIEKRPKTTKKAHVLTTFDHFLTKNARPTTTFDHFFTQKLWTKQFGNLLSDYCLLIIDYCYGMAFGLRE